jgi:spermidine/putrescine-binding protein
MKHLKFLAVAAVLFGCTMFANTAQAQTKYYVVSGWLKNYDTSENRPVVSNVVRVSCGYQSESMVKVQFNDFWKSFYKRTGYTFDFGRGIVWVCETADKAEAKRRELIADFNNKWDTFIIKDFSVTCDD